MSTPERAHATFALALHQELVRNLPAGQNLPWSPYSVAAALGLAAAGARGRTYDELAEVLAAGGTPAALGRLLASAAAPPQAEAAVANSLWMNQQLRFAEQYQRAVLDWPGGAVHTADFSGDPEGCRAKINDDVAQTTRGLVRDLLAPGMVGPETAAVIVNALYLKVAWQHAFEAGATRDGPFHAPAGTRQVPTMRQQERLRYATAGGWRMVTLSTVSDVVADVLLPAGGDQPELTTDILLALQESGRPTKVDLALPRFRVQAAAVLNPHLQRLGVAAAFAPQAADFSGIGAPGPDHPAKKIFIDTVVHKTVLRVDEQGFEGAAATAVVMRMTSMDLGRPVPFHVDRPFLLVIRHRRTGATYFLARIVDP